jgi:hypothetical protein
MISKNICVLLVVSMIIMSCSTTTVTMKNGNIEIYKNTKSCQIGDSILIERKNIMIAKDSIQTIGFQNRTKFGLAYLAGFTSTILLTIPVSLNQCNDEDYESGRNGACVSGVFLISTLIGALIVGPLTAAISNGYAEDRREITECNVN